MPIKSISKISSLSVIGLGKNAGKTTFLNKILSDVYEGEENPPIIGLTSIGRDGEETDVVTSTSKPKIYIRRNTLIATASDLLRKCDITKEILETTEIPTAMGQVVILRALSDGFVEIAGPSSTSDLRFIEKTFKKYTDNLFFLVDGALSRKSTAGHSLTQATILCTGASVNENEETLTDITMNTVNLLTLEGIDEKYNELLKDDTSRVVIIDEDYEGNLYKKSIDTDIALKSASEIKDNLTDDTVLIMIRGAITDNFIKQISDNIKFRNLILCAEDGTRFLTNPITGRNLEIRNINLKVLKEINLVCIGINPYSTSGYMLDSDSLKSSIEKRLLEVNKEIEVIDVRRYEGRIF